MIQDQMRRKKRKFPKGDHHGDANLTVEVPLIDGTLSEIDQALNKSADILKRPTEVAVKVVITKPKVERREVDIRSLDITQGRCGC